MSHAVIIKDVVKNYDDFYAINHVSLDIKKGEFFTLLGPSGCGKTTLLRMIAGFNTIDGGEIYFDDKLMNNIVAHKRDIGMVFQNYAIFPHLNVEENVAYGLKARKVPNDEIKKRVEEALIKVKIEKLAKRKPNELSGGQQQRVALARAFVIEPGVLLMDEPLSNLDAKLRVQMRTTIKKLQRDLGITTIYVTHDQEEALAISDRIAVFNEGKVMQVGKPIDIYLKPANPFVAGFIGVSNFINGNCITKNKNANITLIDGTNFDIKFNSDYEGDVIVSVRPEYMEFSDKGIEGEITLATFLGDFVQFEITLKDNSIVTLNSYNKNVYDKYKENDKVHLFFDLNRISVYKKDTGEVLTC